MTTSPYLTARWSAMVSGLRRSILVTGTLATLAGCASSRLHTYVSDPQGVLEDRARSVVCVPLKTVDMLYVNNTRLTPEAQFDDAFLLEAVNKLLGFELAQRHRLVSAPDTLAPHADSLGFYDSSSRYSTLAGNDADSGAAARAVRHLCKLTGADLVMWPHSCALNHTVHQPRTWRSEGPSYERPVEYTARSTIHVQLWGQDGRLLYECVAGSDKTRPPLYSLLGRKRPDEDLVRYAKRLYAPPLVKSLYQAVRRSMVPVPR